MYYTAFEAWIEHPVKNQPRYNLKLATSLNGIDWCRIGQCNNTKTPMTRNFRPSLLIQDGLYRLWFIVEGLLSNWICRVEAV